MSPGILGKKIGMTQVFRPDGQAVPVTLLKAGPCMVVQRKTPTTDGYDAVQLGLVEFVKPQRINKPADRPPEESRRGRRKVYARVPFAPRRRRVWLQRGVAGDGFVEIVHVSLVMAVVVDFHRQRVNVRFQGLLGIG